MNQEELIDEEEGEEYEDTDAQGLLDVIGSMIEQAREDQQDYKKVLVSIAKASSGLSSIPTSLLRSLYNEAECGFMLEDSDESDVNPIESE